MKDPKDIIISFYKDKEIRGPAFNDQENIQYIRTFPKLGENILLSSIPEKAFKELKNITLIDDNIYSNFVLSKNKYYSQIEKTDSSIINKFNRRAFFMDEVISRYNCGNGNGLQQLYRALNLQVDIKPKGNLYIKRKIIKNRIGIHLDSVSGLTLNNYTRSISSNNLKIIQKFIDNNSHQYSFIQFGQGINKNIKNDKTGLLNNVEDFLNKSLEETSYKVAECDFFICINSSFYHLAISLDIKTICIINLPTIYDCYLPILKNEMLLCEPPFLRWEKNCLYPQAVHLHQQGENSLVKKFSEYNLIKALNGEVYPFWTDKYLDLINVF